MRDDTRRWFRWGLGALWLLDGLLQLQPAMFGPALSRMFVASAVGSPGWVVALVAWGARWFALAPAVANSGAVAAQVGIGVLILMSNRVWCHWGLRFSVVWGAVVWVFGEAFGGILAPGASLLTGAPGSVLFYVSAALLLLRSDTWLERWGAQAMAWLVGAYWFLGAGLMVVSGGFVPGALAAAVDQAAATPQPALLSGPMAHVGWLLARHPHVGGSLLFFVFLALGELWLVKRPTRWVSVLSFATLAAMWWFGMDFGVLGGTGTDPNTAPVMALFVNAAAARPLWRWRGIPRRVPAGRPVRHASPLLRRMGPR